MIYVFIITMGAILGHSFWLSALAPKSRVAVEMGFESMSIEKFYALVSYAADEFNWGLIYMHDDSIRFVTGQSLGSYGEVILISYLDENNATFETEYLSQKTGWGQLSRLYPKFINKFNEALTSLSDLQIDDIFNNTSQSYAEYYKNRNPDADDWNEI